MYHRQHRIRYLVGEDRGFEKTCSLSQNTISSDEFSREPINEDGHYPFLHKHRNSRLLKHIIPRLFHPPIANICLAPITLPYTNLCGY